MPSGRYLLRTFGCQMNEHDSERIAGLLTSDGYVSTTEASDADVVVFNTCAIRENADNRLYGNLGHLRPLKEANPRMRIVVAGCLAQKDGARIQERAPWVDVVIGTHALPGLLDLLHTRRGRRAADGRARVHRGVPERAPGAARGRPPRVGLDRGRLRQRVHVLHRAARPRARSGPGRSATCWRRSRGSPATGSSR